MDISSTGKVQQFNEFEQWWCDHYEWLKENGYVLRPRYAPGWEPSWKNAKGLVFESQFEDGQTSLNLNILDAVRRDGKQICMKRISLELDPTEPEIMQSLSSPEMLKDPSNHCVPLEKALQVPGEDSVIIIIPLLRAWDSPPLGTTGEAIDFIRQLLEGVNFMHKHGFAHRDIKSDNVMMDASGMYPKGFHFVDQDRSPDFKGAAQHLDRTQRPPKYYLIDFGHAKKYDITNGPPIDMPTGGGDKTVPEHQGELGGKLCNPFKVDVYCTGNILRGAFTEGIKLDDHVQSHPKSGFGFLGPLIASMTQEVPENRPTMEEALKHFDQIIGSLSDLKLRSRVAEKREWFILTVARDIPHWGRAARYMISGLSAVPKTQTRA